ncbi:MAG: nucleotide exchange factor GrpE [Caulobacterales bacterium 32-69-10]|nr:MAG: nucleotide exchange factor GrpE [Caulobacterales bacterium 32-69-10]
MVDEVEDEYPEDIAADAADEIEALRSEVAALKDQALRYAAEAENTKRRAEREVNDARAFAIQKFSRDLFEVADNLSRALQAARSTSLGGHPEPAVKNLVLGIEMTDKAVQAAFERNGLKAINPARGDKFDPHLHQAVMEQPADDVPPGSVSGVMQTGYELFGRVVRPAMVVTTPKGPAATPASNGAYAEDDSTGAAVDTKA